LELSGAEEATCEGGRKGRLEGWKGVATTWHFWDLGSQFLQYVTTYSSLAALAVVPMDAAARGTAGRRAPKKLRMEEEAAREKLLAACIGKCKG
jgi:hypothetical protein